MHRLRAEGSAPLLLQIPLLLPLPAPVPAPQGGAPAARVAPVEDAVAVALAGLALAGGFALLGRGAFGLELRFRSGGGFLGRDRLVAPGRGCGGLAAGGDHQERNRQEARTHESERTAPRLGGHHYGRHRLRG